MFLVACFSLQATELRDISVLARSAILMNAETGAILYEKKSREIAYPASLTKAATALYILDNQRLALQHIVKVSSEALKMQTSHPSPEPHWLIPDGTMMGLKKGEEISIESLLHGMMLSSGNDAANVLAEAHSGSIPRFIEELNQYLRGVVGCTQTQFCNPHGIHHDEHFTTAYDLCLIAQRALKIQKFREIVSKVVYQCPKTNRRPAMEIRQNNALLKMGPHYYPKAIGVKTGYISTAMNTLIAAAEHEGRTLIAVLLGCPKREDRYRGAVRLFETAFQEEKIQRRLVDAERIFIRTVPGAKTPLNACLAKDLEITFFPSEEPECRACIQWDIPTLPIHKGQKVGEIHILDPQQRVIQRGELFSREDVQGKRFFMWMGKFLGVFHQK